jgi:hypothetical protein
VASDSFQFPVSCVLITLINGKGTYAYPSTTYQSFPPAESRMFTNLAISASKPTAEATTAQPDHHDVDQSLADTHRDMTHQAKNPSARRKAYDHVAFDAHPRLPLSQLAEYLLNADMLKTSGKSDEHCAALECLSRTITSAYEKSACFRRLFNHAWATRLHDPRARSSLTVSDSEPQPGHATLLLPDVLKRGPKPRYESAAGPNRLSNERAVLNATVKALTQLPEEEPGHPRGPNAEYVNIVLKEMGIRDSAQTALHKTPDRRKASGKGPAATALNQVMLRLGHSAGVPGPGDVLRGQAKAYLNRWVDEKLAMINARGVPANGYLAQVMHRERQSLQALPALLVRLFQDVRGDETAVELLKKISSQNVRQKLFTYKIDKFREPAEMVAHRNGDCKSFCSLYLLLGQAAQITGISQVNLEGAMRMRPPSSLPQIAGETLSEDLGMAGHSILKVEDGAHCHHFDPVFGQQVDPAFYGQDQERYFFEEARPGGASAPSA